MRLWIALILNVVALVLWEFLDVVTEIPRLLQGAVLLVLVVPFALLVAAGMRGASRLWELPIADPVPAAEPVPESRTGTLIEPLTQDEYVALLEGDRGRQRAFTLGGPERTWCYCRQCHRRAVVLEIVHPIWDGPFDGVGSGIVDTRMVAVCFQCAPQPVLAPLGAVPGSTLETSQAYRAVVSGRPIRLPWLDRLPIRLHPELFDRPAFHGLSIRVERWRPPETPPAERSE